MHKKLYGQKQAGKVWYDYLAMKPTFTGFCQSTHDRCVFFRGACIYVLYTDDTILFGATKKVINDIIKGLKRPKLNLTAEGEISDFLGVS